MASEQQQPYPAMHTQEAPSHGVTNIYAKKVENLFVTQANHHELHGMKCSVHEDRSVDFLCVVCEQVICQLCKMSEHERHDTKTISLAAEEAKRSWMSVCSTRIKQHEQAVRAIMEESQKQIQDLREAENTVKKKLSERCHHLQCLIGVECTESKTLLVKVFQERYNSAQKKTQRKNWKCDSTSKLNLDDSMPAISLRQETLLAMIDEQKKHQLEQLEALTREVWTGLTACVKNMEEELETIDFLQKKMDAAISEKDHYSILTLHRQAAVDFSAERLRSRLCKLSPTVHYLVYHGTDREIDENDVIGDIFWTDQKEVVERYIQSFLGHAVRKLVPAKTGVEGLVVQLKPAFRCSQQPESHVKSLCPHGRQRVMVSFASSPNTPEGKTKTFDISGKELELQAFGLGSLKSLSTGQGGVRVGFLPLESESSSSNFFAKHEKHYMVKSSHEETKSCFNFYMIYLDESGMLRETLVDKYSSNIGACKTTAFDASRSGDSFAVVNFTTKNKYSAHGFLVGARYDRELLILDRRSDGSLQGYTYSPPAPNFFPTDVCYLDVNGDEVLAVADVESSSIHLACRSSDSGGYVFNRYLVEDNHLLTCPTALNTDAERRLWVACKGGHLLVAEMVVQ